MKTTLTFEIDVEIDRAAALDRRDEIIDVLKKHGMDLVLTDDGTRIVMYDHGEAYGVARKCSHPEFAHGHCGEITCLNYYGKV